jgi:hypothetical protein
MSAFLNMFLALFIAFAAIMYPNVSKSIVNSGIMDSLESNEHNPSSCAAVKAKELSGCENGMQMDHLVYFSCATEPAQR